MSTELSSPPVPVLRSEDEFRASAASLAESIRAGVLARDHQQKLPMAELDELRDSGLLGLPVPAAYGGVGASHVTLIDVFVALAEADPAFTQILQPHVSMLELLRAGGSEAQRSRFFSEALRGKRFGNALSERGTTHVWEYRTRLTRTGAESGTRLLQGTKYYSTGALGADWIGVLALDDSDNPVLAFVPGNAPGLSVEQDWTAFGQRATISGTSTFNGVAVPEENLVDTAIAPSQDHPTTGGAHAQILHGALDVGIARGALADGIAFVRERGRPYPEAGVSRAADEQGVQQHYGRLATLVDAATALLRQSAEALDLAAREPQDADIVNAARLAVAKAKAFAGEVALEVTTGLFEGAGASAADAKHGLDRHWRNARTHTLHDPNRWKYIHLGQWLLNDTAPTSTNHLV